MTQSSSVIFLLTSANIIVDRERERERAAISALEREFFILGTINII